MKNKKFFSIGSVFSKFFSSSKINSVNEDLAVLAILDEMDLDNTSDLREQKASTIIQKNNTVEPSVSSLPKNKTTDGTDDDINNKPSKPLPPPFGENYIAKKKTENTDDSSESFSLGFKPLTPEQVKERIKEVQEARAEMERREKEQLTRVHVHSR